MKSKRQEKILELIADHSVQTQEQLLTELNEAGFSTTQATISRDIKQLRIIKELGPEGVYRYATAPKPAEHTFSAKLNLIFRQCITSVDYAQNMIVVKTMPGLANGAAAAIDKLNIPEMLGTLAGDDTCFVVLKDTLRNLDHAVTAVYLDGDAWILDNLSNAVLSHKRLSHYRPQFSVNEEYRWAHLTPSAPKKTGR